MPHWSYAVVATALSDDPREAPKLAQQAGLHGIQIDAFSSGLRVTELSGSGRREFVRVLAAHNLQLAGLRLALDAKGLFPGSDIDRTLDALDGVLEATAALQAPLVCLDVGSLPPPPGATLTAAPAPDATDLEEIPRRVDPIFIATADAALADLGARADRYGVTIAMRSELSSMAALERAIKHADCPWFGVDLDPVSILRDRWTLDEVFAQLGPLVRRVRGRDANVALERRTRAAVVGAGDTHWPKLLANLDGTGYRGWITLDPLDLTDRRGAVTRGLQYLLKC